MSEVDNITAQIVAGQSLSAEIDIGSKSLVGLQIPSNWTTAALSFQVSVDGGTTWNELITAGGTPFRDRQLYWWYGPICDDRSGDTPRRAGLEDSLGHGRHAGQSNQHRYADAGHAPGALTCGARGNSRCSNSEKGRRNDR
jgi:hypothetical protein